MSKLIDLSTYNLIYFRKSDNRKFLGKLITKTDRRLIDSETGDVIDLTEHYLRKDYRPNKKLNNKNMVRKNIDVKRRKTA